VVRTRRMGTVVSSVARRPKGLIADWKAIVTRSRAKFLRLGYVVRVSPVLGDFLLIRKLRVNNSYSQDDLYEI
jgi:hypothetical protein